MLECPNAPTIQWPCGQQEKGGHATSAQCDQQTLRAQSIKTQ
jgi:hypothetical protein